ncbi:hypothetical protein DFH05DRAFT_1503853 [Lentinula detonsa]|uniref:Uncharacterized protein n=1 Tax=Lentinula detonsa TaxID=2804962 RepID=A0A9W8NWA1_9AGAR|nr:hypothetical protein DFH05DRAFT_1503853 [Lentinula detonsa]
MTFLTVIWCNSLLPLARPMNFCHKKVEEGIQIQSSLVCLISGGITAFLSSQGKNLLQGRFSHNSLSLSPTQILLVESSHEAARWSPSPLLILTVAASIHTCMQTRMKVFQSYGVPPNTGHGRFLEEHNIAP